MEKITVSNGNLTVSKNINEKGQFIKGNIVSRCKRIPSQTKKLIIALNKAGKKQNPPVKFWDAVADAFFVNKDIMKTVVNKLIPNTSEITGLGGEPINITLHKIIYSEIKEEINEP